MPWQQGLIESLSHLPNPVSSLIFASVVLLEKPASQILFPPLLQNFWSYATALQEFTLIGCFRGPISRSAVLLAIAGLLLSPLQ